MKNVGNFPRQSRQFVCQKSDRIFKWILSPNKNAKPEHGITNSSICKPTKTEREWMGEPENLFKFWSKHFVNEIIKIKLSMKSIRFRFSLWMIKFHWLSHQINRQNSIRKASSHPNGHLDDPLINRLRLPRASNAIINQ